MRTPTVREIPETEYLRRRAEMNRRDHATQRDRVRRAVLVSREAFHDVYPPPRRR
jgi:hypothetical protein